MDTYFKKLAYPHLEHKICFMDSHNGDIYLFCETCHKVVYDERRAVNESIKYYDNILEKEKEKFS